MIDGIYIALSRFIKHDKNMELLCCKEIVIQLPMELRVMRQSWLTLLSYIKNFTLAPGHALFNQFNSDFFNEMRDSKTVAKNHANG